MWGDHRLGTAVSKAVLRIVCLSVGHDTASALNGHALPAEERRLRHGLVGTQSAMAAAVAEKSPWLRMLRRACIISLVEMPRMFVAGGGALWPWMTWKVRTTKGPCGDTRS